MDGLVAVLTIGSIGGKITFLPYFPNDALMPANIAAGTSDIVGLGFELYPCPVSNRDGSGVVVCVATAPDTTGTALLL